MTAGLESVSIACTVKIEDVYSGLPVTTVQVIVGPNQMLVIQIGGVLPLPELMSIGAQILSARGQPRAVSLQKSTAILAVEAQSVAS